MREEFNHIELIENYLQGKLRGKELEDFELRLLNEERLQEEVEVQRLFVSGIENAGLKQSLQFIHHSMFETPASFLSRNWINLLAGGSFCMVIIIASIFAAFNGKTSQESAGEYINLVYQDEYNGTMIRDDFSGEEGDTFKLIPPKIPESVVRMSKKFPAVEIKSFYYSLDPNKDTMITGKEGTVISIPKNCFAFTDGSGLSKIYSLELKEAYKISEIILNDLSHSLNNTSYLTNGSVFINATESEKLLQFLPGKNIYIRFPSLTPENQHTSGNKVNDNTIYYKLFSDEPEKRLINIPVDVLDYELNYISTIKDDRYYTTSYAERHMNEKIEGLTDERYNNTFVSSIQFHYRIEGSQLYGEGEELLDIYLKNTHLKLWEADSMVAAYLRKKAASDCKNFGKIMKAEEYFRWLKSQKLGGTVNIPQLEYRNYHKGQIYNKVPHTKEIRRLQNWGVTRNEAVEMLDYFKKIYYYKSRFKEAQKNKGSLDYYYSNQGRYVECEINACSPTGTPPIEAKSYLPVHKTGWINYEKLPNEKMISSLKVNVKGVDTSAYVKIYIVFNKLKYISVASWTKNEINTFESLPKNSSASLVGISYYNDKIYYAKKEIVTDQLSYSDLELKPVEENVVRKDLSELDK